MKRTGQQPKPKKTDTERALDAVDAMLLRLEKELWKRAKAAAKRGWFAQALGDDNGSKLARSIYSTEMFHLRVRLGARR